MDENSSDSICSDDTEYLLGQNVSIRDIDDYDEKPSRVPSIKQRHDQHTTSLQHRTSPETRKSNLKKIDVISQQDSNKYQQKHHMREQTKIVNFQHQSSKTIELTPPDSRTLKKPVRQNKTRTVQDDSKSHHSSHQTHISSANHREKSQTKSTEKRKPNVASHFEERHIKEEPLNNQSEKMKEMRIENKRGWREKMSPLQHDQSWDWNQAKERHHSPEQADIISITSEAATEELLKDDELDGSIIQKLKELNLAVNYDPDTQGRDCNSIILVFSDFISHIQRLKQL